MQCVVPVIEQPRMPSVSLEIPGIVKERLLLVTVAVVQYMGDRRKSPEVCETECGGISMQSWLRS